MKMQDNQNKYLFSGLLFSFALSTTYIPTLFCIWGEHPKDPYSMPLTVGIFLVIVFLNLIYIYFVRNGSLRSKNLLLIPVNVLVFGLSSFLVAITLKGNIHYIMMALILSSMFLLLPWIFLIKVTSSFHKKYFTINSESLTSR
jgi:hypothetical protein